MLNVNSKNALQVGQDVPTTFEMPTTFEHTKTLPTTFDKNPLIYDISPRLLAMLLEITVLSQIKSILSRFGSSSVHSDPKAIAICDSSNRLSLEGIICVSMIGSVCP